MYVDDMTAALHSALKSYVELTMIIRWRRASKAEWIMGFQGRRPLRQDQQ
jgi:hypothetical protein